MAARGTDGGQKPAGADRVEPVAAPAPGRTRTDPESPETFGFRNLGDAPEVEDNGPGATAPQRVEVTSGSDANGNSTFASRAAARGKRVGPGGAENKAVDAGLIRSTPTTGDKR